MSGCESNTAAYHFDLSDNIAGNPAVTPDYPMVGGKRRTKRRTKRSTKRRKASIKSGGYPQWFDKVPKNMSRKKYLEELEKKKKKKNKKKRSKKSKRSKKRSRKRTNKSGGNAVPIVVGATALGLGAAGYMYYKNKKKNITPEPDNTCEELMCSKGIYTKKDFHNWARANHPDKKQGDNDEENKAIAEKFGSVSNCKDNDQYCK